MSSILNKLLVRDLCANNCPTREQNGNCIQSEPRLNQTYHWVAHYYCSCNEHYRISSDNKSCTGMSYHVMSCHVMSCHVVSN
jgi:hypothetical protein